MAGQTKEKIAITIDQNLLRRVDRMIDGEKIRNRSHAIESLVNQALRPKAKKALICAGENVAVKPQRDGFPATLLPFEGKSVIEHQIERLRSAGIKEIAVLVKRGAGKIQELLGDGEKYGVQIAYLEQDQKEIGSGYALFLAKKFLAKEDVFVVLYGDVFAQIDLADFVEYHVDSDSIATVALTSIEDTSLYGVVGLRGEKIVSFTEKPKEKESVSRVINAGIFCFEQPIFSYVSANPKDVLETNAFPRLAKEGKLGGYVFEGKWCNVRNQVCYGSGKV